MSIKQRLISKASSTPVSPRMSAASENRQFMKNSLNLLKNSVELDRSLNATQMTDRSYQSPRPLNSQRASPRGSFANNLNQSMRQSLRETQSFLDSSVPSKSLSINGKKMSSGHERRKTMSTKSQGFALNFYKMPNCQYYNDTKILTKFLPGKKDHFLNQIIKSKQFMPSPDKYEVTRSFILPGDKKRVFSKLPRLTMAAEIIKKGSSTPGPGTYRLDFKPKKREGHKRQLERELGFINEAQYRGTATPFAHDAKFNLVEKKVRATNFRLSTVERSVRIEKKPGLSPVSYEPLNSFKKTQL